MIYLQIKKNISEPRYEGNLDIDLRYKKDKNANSTKICKTDILMYNFILQLHIIRLFITCASTYIKYVLVNNIPYGFPHYFYNRNNTRCKSSRRSCKSEV